VTCGPVATVNRHVTPTDGTIVPSLLDYLRVLRRRKVLFLLIVLIVPATAVAVSLAQAPAYQASADVLLTTRDLGTAYIDPQRVAQTRAELARVPAVVDPVLDAVPSAGLDREEFLETSAVSATLGSDILTFSVENSDPGLATQLATEYASSFTEYQQALDNQAVETMLEQVRQQLAELEARGEAGSPTYEALQRREEALAGVAAAQPRSAQVVKPAGEAPRVGPRTVRNGLIAVCLGLVLALVVVFLVDALDTRVRSVDAIREALGLRLLGRLAAPPSRLRKDDGLVMLADPTSREAEQFRALRASLDLANAEHGARTIMITSAVDGEGKSTTVANLAVVLARAGRRVVLIDADLSNPQLHRLFDVDQRPGMTEVELGETPLAGALRPIALTEDSSLAESPGRRMEHIGSLEMVPAGSTLQDPDELGYERAVGRIIKRVRGRADVVLVDAPPILRGPAIALSAHVDAVVVVVRLTALRASALQEMGWMLDAASTTKLGFIVTGADKSDDHYGQQPRFATRGPRPEARPRPTPTVPPPAANVNGDEPAQQRSKSPGRPFGGLSPREAGLRSAQARRAKSAERAADEESAGLDAAQDGLEDD
jgi:succinoglycan biosynthesis transport protein ExoP